MMPLRAAALWSMTLAVLAGPRNAHSDDALVTVEPAQAMVVAGEVVDVTVTNKRAGSVFLPGCSAARVERFENEHYVPLPSEPCVSEGATVEVKPGTHVLKVTTSADRAGQIVRAAVTYGWGCEGGRELSQSRCEDFATAYSSSFRLVKRGG